MAGQYSVETVSQLAERFAAARLGRPMRVRRYEAGQELVYEVTPVLLGGAARVRLVVEAFVGGGFAGQVYRVRLSRIEAPGAGPEGLEVGGIYAVKILIPPSAGSQRFRDLIYAVGFQGPFALQCNPAAARAGALWQKFIRRAAGIRFGDERAVVDVLATFVDQRLGSCGEISEWVDGRTWRFEVDDRLFARRRWRPGQAGEGLGSPEYRAKRQFMADFVKLLHEVGAPELARQYEWWTCKSQPNVLKRLDAPDEPAAGLTAVDFRAGLALLPFLPMSPGDVKLILKGMARGSLVQFDRGDLHRLRAFMDAHAERFADMREAFEELTEAEREYRDSQIDVTHNHVGLLYSGRLWSSILDGAVTGWAVRNVTDEGTTKGLRESRLLTLAFAAVGLLPLLGLVGGIAAFFAGLAAGASAWRAVGVAAAVIVLSRFFGKLLRKVWGRADFRRHLWGLCTSLDYLGRAVRGHVAESLIRWHRAGRLDSKRAAKIADQPWRFFCHLPFTVLPGRVHRFCTDRRYAAGVARSIFVRPVRLYFNAAAREQWLREMVAEGRARHMLTDEDAEAILSRVGEPFIQKYLKSLAVHVCTLPVTQVVSVTLAAIWVLAHPDRPTAWAEGLGILAAFQVTPISPGSLVRGFYVLYLVLSEKNFKDYNIAVFLGFFKYVGYLAFPIQMTYRYPALARFMAAHWATGAVRIVPIFGEHGALLEHGVFDRFYNYPLSVRRRMRKRAALRAGLAGRAWHGFLATAAGIVVLGLVAAVCRSLWGTLPRLRDIWPATILVPAALGAAATAWAGGKPFARRINLSVLCGFALGLGYGVLHAALRFLPALGGTAGDGGSIKDALSTGAWSAFIFTLVAAVAALLTEVNLPEPNAVRRLNELQQPETQQ